MLYICYIFIYLIVEKDAIAFFQNITKDELLLSEKEKSSLWVCVCVCGCLEDLVMNSWGWAAKV